MDREDKRIGAQRRGGKDERNSHCRERKSKRRGVKGEWRQRARGQVMKGGRREKER